MLIVVYSDTVAGTRIGRGAHGRGRSTGRERSRGRGRSTECGSGCIEHERSCSAGSKRDHCIATSSNMPPHTLESQMRDTNGFIAIGERLKKIILGQLNNLFIRQIGTGILVILNPALNVCCRQRVFTAYGKCRLHNFNIT